MTTITIETTQKLTIDGHQYNATINSEVTYTEGGLGTRISSIECLSAFDSEGVAVPNFEEQGADFYRDIEKNVYQVFMDEFDYCTPPDDSFDDFEDPSYENGYEHYNDPWNK